MKCHACLLVFLFAPLRSEAQTTDDSDIRLTFFPSGLQFAPLKANSQEARIGILKFLDFSGLAVDIGNASEIAALTLPGAGMNIAMGVDFFGKGFVTGSQGLRLQVDAIDGFFGGHLSWSKEYHSGHLAARLRVLHQSAHFVDGHYSLSAGTWIDHRAPIPFTRDFGELTLGHLLAHPAGSLRYYGGIAYATLVRPAELQRLSYLAGFEFTLDKLLGGAADQAAHAYCAYHISLTGTPVYAASNQVQVGLKVGQWSGRGADFYLAFYDGRHPFGEYFDERLSALGAGCMVDIF